MNTRKLIVILIAVIIAVTLVVIIAVQASTAARQEQDYRACLADGGLHQTGSLDDATSIADRCMTAVYGEQR